MLGGDQDLIFTFKDRALKSALQGPPPIPQILADQLTLPYLGREGVGHVVPRTLLGAPSPGFSSLPLALVRHQPALGRTG